MVTDQLDCRDLPGWELLRALDRLRQLELESKLCHMLPVRPWASQGTSPVSLSSAVK